jgi:hypothetical protein
VRAPAAEVVSRPAPDGTAAPAVYLERLEGLAAVLAGRGMRTRLMTPLGRMPSLHVVNPAAPSLAEDIYACRCTDGRWWFWWPWAERIAETGEPEAAATIIGRVLAARSC